METNYFYLIKEREFVRSGESTYKIGKTGQNPPFKRFSGYPRGSEVILLLKVVDKDTFEKKVIKFFKRKYQQMRQYGTEYFQGDVVEMIKDIVALNSILNKPPFQEPRPKPPKNTICDWFIHYANKHPIQHNEIRISRRDAYEDYCSYVKHPDKAKHFKHELIRSLECKYKRFASGQFFVFNVEETNKMLMMRMLLDEAPLKGCVSDYSDSDSDSDSNLFSDSDSDSDI